MNIWTRLATKAAVLLAIVAVVVALTACSTTKEEILPQDGPAMMQIYDRHMKASGAAAVDRARGVVARPLSPGREDLAAYTRYAADEIAQRFPLLPNPQMVLFVFPHLSADGAPVPAYSTAFPMYPVDRYALPGEVYRP